MAQERTPQPSLFSWVVQQHLDPEHPLLVLSGKIDWKGIDSVLAPYYARSSTGRPPKPTRLMVGLMILKHRFDLSDEEVVQELHENVVWMVFCGVPPEEVHFVESSTLCKFRKRGCVRKGRRRSRRSSGTSSGRTSGSRLPCGSIPRRWRNTSPIRPTRGFFRKVAFA